MQWVRIIDCASDVSFAQKFLEGIALLDSNGVLVVDVFESLRRERRHDAGNLGEEPVVFRGVRLAGARAGCKMGALLGGKRRLGLVGAAVSRGAAARASGGEGRRCGLGGR